MGAALLDKDCPTCGNGFTTYQSINKKHCSKECFFAAQKKHSFDKYKCLCAECGVEFLPPRQSEGGTFCSYLCRGRADRIGRVRRMGYWAKVVEGHPRATAQGYVAEHRLVMESHLGRYLLADEVVHHIDHDRGNNDIDNLALMTDSAHKSMHATKKYKAENPARR